MDYILAFVTLFVVFVVPAAIVTGLVAQPEKKRGANSVAETRGATSQHPGA